MVRNPEPQDELLMPIPDKISPEEPQVKNTTEQIADPPGKCADAELESRDRTRSG